MGRIYENLIKPALFRLDAETAHDIGLRALRYGLGTAVQQDAAKRYFGADFEFGPIESFGLKFANPLGMAAGFDKNGVVTEQLAALGFGFVEVGTVTARPQPGNPKPRLFRLPADGAIINRFGFNNDGAKTVAARLRRSRRTCVIGVNIGKNKDVPLADAIGNYLESLREVHDVADYVAVNISSPNTPNLRELQRAESLEVLLKALVDETSLLNGRGRRVPILVKIAPDLTEAEIESIVGAVLKVGVDGVIATNTTIGRDGLKTAIEESGGLSGQPLRPRSTRVIRLIRKYSDPRLPVIGVGGIFGADDAFEKIAAGATLVQAYTGFIYRGPSFAGEIVRGLARILDEKGFSNYTDAIGSERAAC